MTVADPVYTVSEAAEATGLSAHTLRYYEREGLIAPIGRADSSGHRTYRPQDLRAIEFLKRLRATGMSIEMMRRYVTLVRQGDATLAERRALLVAHRDAVAQRIAEMQQHLDVIDYKIANVYNLDGEAASCMDAVLAERNGE